MILTEKLQEMMEYVYEGALEVFSPNHDDYPAVGIQPFEGEVFKD